MTTIANDGRPADRQPTVAVTPPDHRGSPLPTRALIATRFMELTKRRGLMIALAVVTIGIPTAFMVVRLVMHAAAPKTYGPAGGYDVYTGLTAGVLYVFGFIVAATLGVTAGSSDLTDGMFRHLVVTGRSRIALYLARIPAGLGIIAPLIAIGFAIVCAVCVFAAPTTLNYDGAHVPAHLSRTGLENWAADHSTEVLCRFNYSNIDVNAPCGPVRSEPGGVVKRQVGQPPPVPTPAALSAAARQVAQQDYPDYKKQFLTPSNVLMIETGLWIELEAAIGFLVGLGLGSLIGQRSIGMVLMIVLEVILTPIVIRARIPHFENVQRAVVGVATARLEPGQLPLVFGGGGQDFRVTESTGIAIVVIVAWLIGWTVLGAWRMTTRDA